jgi:hypothetical protein
MAFAMWTIGSLDVGQASPRGEDLLGLRPTAEDVD